ncbi:MAG: hypothetical protein RSE36_06735 [Oscillospiraceae bacterium]
MKNIKIALALILALVMVLAFASCKTEEYVESEKPVSGETQKPKDDGASAAAGTFGYEVPQDFTELEKKDGQITYVSDKYPEETSNIVYTESPGAYFKGAMTAEKLEKTFELAFKNQYDLETDIVIDAFEEVEIESFPGYIVVMHYELQGQKVFQTQLMLGMGEKLHNLVFTQMNDEDYSEKFGNCLDSVTITAG